MIILFTKIQVNNILFIGGIKEMHKQQRVAEFQKVSKDQFIKDCEKFLSKKDWENNKNNLDEIYENILLPKRATKGSAGYDFCFPFETREFYPNEELLIPTGIRCKFYENSFSLDIVPRSSLGFKSGIRLANTIGIIDSDYYYADNEGHIMIKLVFPVNKEDAIFSWASSRKATLEKGSRFAQGIFHQFGITIDDDAEGLREGGFGSTGK